MKTFNKIITSTLLVSILVSSSVVASNNDSFYSKNDIVLYGSGGDDSSSCGGSGSFAIDGLYEGAVAKLDSQNVRDRVEKNKDRYLYAEQHTGVPWQVVAALHFREAGLNPDKSIQDGSSLSAGVSLDGLKIDPDPNKDAMNGANHLKDNAKRVYSLNVSAVESWNFEDWAHAFLAYNRGAMYKKVNEPYTKSPYVMNFIDAEHENMPWIRADSYDGSKKWNNLFDRGQKDGNVGAMAVAMYLGYDFESPGSSSGSQNCGGSGGVVGDIVQTAINISYPERCSNDSSTASSQRSQGKCGDKNQPKETYVKAMSEVGLSGSGCSPSGADCGVFVATVMRLSKADPDFPIGTSSILSYLRGKASAGNGYIKVDATDTSNLMPGDIFIIPGHTMLYVGDNSPDGGKSMASASCSDRTGDRGANIYFSDRRGSYEIYRKI